MKHLSLFGKILAISLTTASVALPMGASATPLYDPALNIAWVSLETGKTLETTVKIPGAAGANLANSKLVAVDGSPGLSAQLVSVTAVSGGNLEVKLKIKHESFKGTALGAYPLAITLQTGDGGQRLFFVTVQVK
jgi:hypothetical protein